MSDSYGSFTMAERLRVVIEVTAARDQHAPIGTDLPGFVPNPLVDVERLGDEWDEQGFRVRGTVDSDELDNLRHSNRVLSVSLDTSSPSAAV
ncbi:MAG: hypothetical protein MI757_21525 [Pirellulales bacterium]|nr:hypothetical protein [Pirellulales bacterium]